MKRVPPSIRMKEEVEALLQGQGVDPELGDGPLEGFVRGTARYMLQVAIEAEATAFLGRGHYRRGDRARVGWRNGYEPKAVQTEAGLLKFAVPQLGDTHARSRSFGPRHVCARPLDPRHRRAVRRDVRGDTPEQEHGQSHHAAADAGVRDLAPT